MTKILAQAGVSLADIYDIEGSIVGVEQLMAREVSTVHEMGGTIFSERLSGEIRRLDSTGLDQDQTWDVEDTTIPVGVSRVLGASVVSLNAARLVNCTLSIREPNVGREIPIFVWDTNEGFVSARFQDNGGTVANHHFLENAINIATLPNMVIGTGQPMAVPNLIFRGLTSSFGAGTVQTIALVYLGFTEVTGEGISSIGLAIPGW